MTPCATITKHDLTVIEKLLEYNLGQAERENILSYLGEGGQRRIVHSFQEAAYAECSHPDYCGDCGICVPYLQEPPLICLLEIIGYRVKRAEVESNDDIEVPF